MCFPNPGNKTSREVLQMDGRQARISEAQLCGNPCARKNEIASGPAWRALGRGGKDGGHPNTEEDSHPILPAF
jgi:hypothetical protein